MRVHTYRAIRAPRPTSLRDPAPLSVNSWPKGTVRGALMMAVGACGVHDEEAGLDRLGAVPRIVQDLQLEGVGAHGSGRAGSAVTIRVASRGRGIDGLVDLQLSGRDAGHRGELLPVGLVVALRDEE